MNQEKSENVTNSLPIKQQCETNPHENALSNRMNLVSMKIG